MRPPRRLGPKEIDELAAEYRSGVRVNDLITRFKIDRKTLYKYLNDRRMPLRKTPSKVM
jgi:DNA invertase Pin-like site-specific DNA recombinase